MSNTIYVALFFTMLIVVRGLIVVCHELGHAFAGMLLYEGDFSIYIGSYGDPHKGVRFKAGRLTIYVIYNPFSWDRGLCVGGKAERSYKHAILYSLGGPLGSLLLSLFFFCFLFTGLDEILKVYAFLAFFYAFADFLGNIIPKARPIQLFDGSITYNDGQQLKTLLKEKNNYGLSSKLVDLYNDKKYEELLAIYEALNQINDPFVLRLAAYSCPGKKQ